MNDSGTRAGTRSPFEPPPAERSVTGRSGENSASVDAPRPDLPTLNRDPSFWGITITQFFGAFNDNLFKQLMLILAIPVAAGAGGEVAPDAQGTATMVFALPFVLMSGFAGFLSDRFSKQTVIVVSKVAEIVAMALGMMAFLMFERLGYAGLLVVLFLMGMQSTFFGPGKYGILPEMLRESDLPRANGIIMMTTFLAIIFGTAAAGGLGDWLLEPQKPLAETAERLWIGSAFCIGIAIVGTLTSLLIRPVPPAQPDLKLDVESLAIPKESRRILTNDRPLLGALLASCMFWLVSGAAMQAVNSLGLIQLGLSKLSTSIMVAVIGLGIALGAVVAGKLSHGRANFRIVRFGAWGITLFLVLLAIPAAEGRGGHLLGFYGSLPVLVLLGMSAGFFAIPIQVFIQSRPPRGQKGRMIAVMNQTNFVAILLSGMVYSLFDHLVTLAGQPRCVLFALIAVLMIPVLAVYRPKN